MQTKQQTVESAKDSQNEGWTLRDLKSFFQFSTCLHVHGSYDRSTVKSGHQTTNTKLQLRKSSQISPVNSTLTFYTLNVS